VNWTTEIPTVPGWYWYRTSEQEKTLLLLAVYAFSDRMKAIWPSGQSESIINMPGEWSGPLELPEG
jgi:tagatose-1,6-bisphosphate aldolase non-catalytic subunit AgaZ/GatZ